MQREIVLLASTVGERFHGRAVDAADALGIVILRRAADRLRAAYTPGKPAVLVVAPTQPLERHSAIALAHHLLRHRSQAIYLYDERGPLYDAPREWFEAQFFAREFMAHTPPPQIRALRRHHAYAS